MAESGAGITGDSSLTVYEEVWCEGERVHGESEADVTHYGGKQSRKGRVR